MKKSILALTDLLGHSQPGCEEHFPRKEIDGAQLVQIKVSSKLYYISSNLLYLIVSFVRVCKEESV